MYLFAADQCNRKNGHQFLFPKNTRLMQSHSATPPSIHLKIFWAYLTQQNMVDKVSRVIMPLETSFQSWNNHREKAQSVPSVTEADISKITKSDNLTG